MSSAGSVVGSQLGMLVAPAAPVACLGAMGGRGPMRVREEPRGAWADACAWEPLLPPP